MKPIEPGCMVVVLAGDYAGRIGTALHFIPAGSEVVVEKPVARRVVLRVDMWAISLDDICHSIGFNKADIMRIDGHEPTTADYELLELVTS